MIRRRLRIFCGFLVVCIAPRLALAEPAAPATPAAAASSPAVSAPQERFQPEQFTRGNVRNLETDFSAVQEALKQQQPLRIDLDAALDRARPLTPGELRQSADRKFSILDLRARALQNNLSLAVINFDPQIAESKAGIERAKFDNIIYANIKRGRQDLPQAGGDIVKFTSETPALQDQELKISRIEQKIDTVEGELGIAIPLRTGGTVKLSTPFERKKTEGVLGSDDYVRATRFSISQPLLRNAGIGVNEASIRVAEFDKQAVDAKTRLQSMRVLSIVDKAYWEVYAAWAELD
ncbi:MAG: TolC family protein, partial [Methylobacterium sp.]|nr:TolC family protein [Methylobacterium sp.]